MLDSRLAPTLKVEPLNKKFDYNLKFNLINPPDNNINPFMFYEKKLNEVLIKNRISCVCNKLIPIYQKKCELCRNYNYLSDILEYSNTIVRGIENFNKKLVNKKIWKNSINSYNKKIENIINQINKKPETLNDYSEVSNKKINENRKKWVLYYELVMKIANPVSLSQEFYKGAARLIEDFKKELNDNSEIIFNNLKLPINKSNLNVSISIDKILLNILTRNGKSGLKRIKSISEIYKQLIPRYIKVNKILNRTKNEDFFDWAWDGLKTIFLPYGTAIRFFKRLIKNESEMKDVKLFEKSFNYIINIFKTDKRKLKLKMKLLNNYFFKELNQSIAIYYYFIFIKDYSETKSQEIRLSKINEMKKFITQQRRNFTITLGLYLILLILILNIIWVYFR